MSQYLTYYLTWAKQLKCIGEKKYAYRFQVNQKARGNVEGLGVDGKIISILV
jgi:hypothetical protein